MATLQDLMGAGIPAGLLDPQQQQALEQRARNQGLLNLGFALLQASQGQPGQKRPGLGQIVAQAGPAFGQAYQGAFDKTLTDILRAQQVQDLQRKRQQEEQFRLGRERFGEMFAPRTPQTALQAPGRVGPTAARAATIGQTPALDRSQLLSAILDPNMPPDVVERAKLAYEATAPAKEPESITKLRTFQREPELAEIEKGIKAAGAPRTNVTVRNALSKAFGEGLQKTLEGVKGLAKPAYDTLATIDSMQTLLDQGVRTGFGQEAVLQFQRAGQALNPNYKVEQIAGQEAFVGAANKIILPQVKQLGVSPTDKDLDFIVKGSPSLGKSVAGNKLMLSALKLKFERDKVLSQFATQWQIQNAQLIQDSPVIADAEFSKSMQEFMQTSPLYTTAVDQLRQQYSQITGGGAPSMLNNSPFVTPSGPY